MGNFWLVFVIVAVALLVFVVAMSLTLIFKGHHIRSEVSENPALRAAGIKCPIAEARGEVMSSQQTCSTDCSTCSTQNTPTCRS